MRSPRPPPDDDTGPLTLSQRPEAPRSHVSMLTADSREKPDNKGGPDGTPTASKPHQPLGRCIASGLEEAPSVPGGHESPAPHLEVQPPPAHGPTERGESPNRARA